MVAPAIVKSVALVVLVLQNALLVLVMRYSQLHKDPNSPLYLASTAVFMGEVFKIVGSIILLFGENSYELRTTCKMIRDNLLVLLQPRELASLSVPAFLYVLQNNLAYLATANLDAAPYQLLYQLKIFTTALLSILLLGKVLGRAHWWALFVLFIGVLLVQVSTMQDDGGKKKDSNQNPLLGLAAILIAVTCSGLSGVWLEKIVKSSSVSLWIRNLQLAIISLFIAAFSVYTKDYTQAVEKGFFSGYNPTVWSVILLQSGGGLVVAVVVKYADNILKGFATSVATVFSTVASVIWFDFIVSPLFVVGALLVLGSAYMYTLADVAAKAAAGGAIPLPQEPPASDDLEKMGEDKSSSTEDSPIDDDEGVQLVKETDRK